MNPFGGPQTPEEEITYAVNVKLLPVLRDVVATLNRYGIEFSANNVMAALAAAETAAGTGNVAVYGNYDTNDVRRWNALFGSFLTWLAGNITVTLASGTETKTVQNLVMKYYAPVDAG